MADVIKKFKNKETKKLIDVKAGTLPALKERAEVLVAIYNDAVQSGNFGAKIEIMSDDGNSVKEELLRDYMEQTVNTYTKVARAECFNRLKATADPMLEAIKQIEFSTIRIADKKVGEEKIPVSSIEPTTQRIALDKLDKHCDGIGVEKGKAWQNKVKSFVVAMSARIGLDHGMKEWNLTEISDSYAMLDIVARMKNGENPTSDEELIKLMTDAAKAMVGDKYDISGELQWCRDNFTKTSSKKALTLICANASSMETASRRCHTMSRSSS